MEIISIIQVLIKRMDYAIDLPLPKQMSSGAAGYDIFAAVTENIILKPGDFELIPLGFALAIPKNYEVQIRPRSGLALKYGVTLLNSPGTIDSDYRGELKVLLINLGSKEMEIKRGDRIAQMIISYVPSVILKEVPDLPQTDRSNGGFGHTGL